MRVSGRSATSPPSYHTHTHYVGSVDLEAEEINLY